MTLTMPLSSTATNMHASTLGTTRRCTADTPSTSIASISSRMVRAPMSAQMADPPAPATSNATTSGLACCTVASTLPAPVYDCAPSCFASEPNCIEMTAPNGIATNAVGRIVTLAMNQACWMNSRNWNGRWNTPRATSSPSANKRPVSRSIPAPGILAVEAGELIGFLAGAEVVGGSRRGSRRSPAEAAGSSRSPGCAPRHRSAACRAAHPPGRRATEHCGRRSDAAPPATTTR